MTGNTDRPGETKELALVYADYRHNLENRVAHHHLARKSSNPRPSLIKGLVVAGLIVGGLGTWAATAPLDSGVIAPGVVITNGQRKQIQHPEGGVVRELLAKPGDQVISGQVLVRLDPTPSETAQGVAQIGYESARAEEARLLAELEGLSSIQFPEELNRHDPQIARILDAQTRLFTARRSSLAGELSILEAQIEQADDEITGLRADQESIRQQIELVEKELEGLRFLLAKGLTARSRVFRLAKDYEGLRGRDRKIDAQIAEIENRIGEKRLQIVQAKKDFQESVLTELRQVHATVRDQDERLQAATHAFDQAEIRAPIDGIVVDRRINTVGGVISAGEVIMELVSVDDDLVIDTRVPISDIDSVQVGQTANILLPALPRLSTPTLFGELIHVSADRIVPPDNSEPAFFRAHVRVPKQEIERLGEGGQLQPGMAAEVIITTGERTALEYLLRPVMLNFARAWLEE